MLISCDAAQLEWRTVLELSQDPVGIQEVLDGQDTHALNQKAFNLPSRLIAKIYLFRTIFNRGMGYSFANDPDFMPVSTSVKFWDKIGKKFYEKYNKIDKLYDHNLTLIGQGKPIVGPLGREWLLEPVLDYKGEMVLPVTKAVNYPTQGTGADVMMLARISFWNRLKKQPWQKYVKLISTVHDSILLDVDTANVEVYEVAKLFHEVFDDLPKNIKQIFGYNWIVPLACEVKAGMRLRDRYKKLADGSKIEICSTGMEELKV